MFRDVLKAGLLTGVGLVAVGIVSALLKWELSGYNMATGLLTWAVIAGCSWYFCKARALSAGDAGYSYGQCLGFIVLTGVVSGVVAGIGYVLIRMVMADYYAMVVDAAIERSREMLESNPLFAGSAENIEESMSVSARMASNPALIFIGSLFNTVIAFTLIGLIVSVFTKRQADPFYEGPAEE